jgi:hypothetical protein
MLSGKNAWWKLNRSGQHVDVSSVACIRRFVDVGLAKNPALSQSAREGLIG